MLIQSIDYLLLPLLDEEVLRELSLSLLLLLRLLLLLELLPEVCRDVLLLCDADDDLVFALVEELSVDAGCLV